MVALANIMANTSLDAGLRKTAALTMKNCIVSKDEVCTSLDYYT